MNFRKKFIILMVSLMSIGLICLGLIPIKYILNADSLIPDGYQEIENYTKPNSIESIYTSSLYPFTKYNGTDTLISGNKLVSNSMSKIRISVKGTGALNFEYRVYSSTLEQENNPDSLLISIGSEIDSSTSYSSFEGDRYYGETGWKSKTILINPENEDDITYVYLGYKKNGSVNSSEDIVLLRNFVFNTNKVNIITSSSDDNYGTVTESLEVLSDQIVNLVANTKTNGKFYGWIEDGKLLDIDSNEYSFVAGKDRNIVAVFGNVNDVTCQNLVGGYVYNNVALALNDATADDVIMLYKDDVINSDVVIPKDVTLYIPYSDEYDEDGNADGDNTCSSSSLALENKTFRRLTIGNDKSLTVKGKLLIGGIIGYPSQLYQGHTSSYHGRITNNGTILVDGGRIDCYGFIDGQGLVNATSGEIYEPFIVYDFSGGNNSLNLFLADQNSFTQYTMQNITCTMILSSNACLGAYCNLYASSKFNKTSGIIVGNRNTYPSALLGLSDGATVTRTVDKTKFIKGGTLNDVNSNYGVDLGKVTYTINGGSKLGNLSMLVEGFDISVDKFPIPYGYDYILKNGTYDIPTGWNIMPGASLIVEDDATLNVNGSLYIFDGLVNTGMSGRYYPSASFLSNNEFATCGVLDLQGTMVLKSGSTFGGIVQSSKVGASLTVEENAKVLNQNVQFGATGSYDDNTCIMDLNGKIMIGNTLTNLSTNKTYESVNTDSWTFESYTVNKYSSYNVSTKPESGYYVGIPSYKNGSNYSLYAVYEENKVVVTNQQMIGKFEIEGGQQGSTDNFTLINRSYYDANDSTRTTISIPVVNGNSATFTVTLTEAGSAYTYLVEYKIDDGEYQLATRLSLGNYQIDNISGNVTILVTSGLKGDVNLDGEVAANDVTRLRRYLAEYINIEDKYSLCFADVNMDGEVAANDVTRLRRYLAEYIDEL